MWRKLPFSMAAHTEVFMKPVLVALLILAALVTGPVARTEAGGSANELREALLILKDRRVNFDLKERHLRDVLKFLSDFSGVNIIISPVLTAELDDHDMDVTLKLSKVTVWNALVIILELKNLKLVYRYGLLMVTTPKDARGKPKLRIYSIGDLTVKIRDFPAPDIQIRPSGFEFDEPEVNEHEAFADPDFIQDLVTQNCGEETWEDEGVSISVSSRRMVVRQYPGVHREIERLLMLLRGYR